MKDRYAWDDFASESEELAATGIKLLYQGSDLASAFLATVAPDQGPRVHPIFPVVALGELWLLIVKMSPKYGDLRRNGTFALHTLPTSEGGEEFHVRGTAVEIADPEVKQSVVDATEGRQGAHEFEMLFRCDLNSVLYTRWENWGSEDAWPSYTKWTSG